MLKVMGKKIFIILHCFFFFFLLCLPKKVMAGGGCVKMIVRGFIIFLTVNVQKTLFSFCSKNKVLVFRAGTHKMFVKIANRENPDQTALAEAL